MTRRADHAERLIMELAAGQHGVVARVQLIRAGVSSDVVEHRLAAGWLRRMHRGVYAVGPVIAPKARELAAVLACGIAALSVIAKARAQGLSLQRTAARRFFMTLAPAFVAGAVLTIALVDAVPRDTIAGAWLLLYGAGLAASGVFAIQAVVTAGIAFMALGIATLALPAGSGPTMLALGFGGIHIVLGEVVRRNHGG